MHGHARLLNMVFLNDLAYITVALHLIRFTLHIRTVVHWHEHPLAGHACTSSTAAGGCALQVLAGPLCKMVTLA